MFQNYFTQAELALAAYANLTTTRPDEAALVDAGMSGAQAAQFAANWLVVAQYNPPSGLSATVFERDGQTFLAIRGTEPTDPGDVAADLDIMAGVNPLGIPQYQNLRAKVNEWLGNGALKPGFTVSGHSLGGFLATTLSAEFAPQISHVYLYNAPGFGGTQSRDVGLTPDASLISNIKSAVPFSPIAGLGRQVQPIISIAAENQFSPDIPNPPVSFNHDQSVLTDTLAIAALYAELTPGLSVGQANWLLQAASSENNRTLESALDALRGTLFGAWALKESATPVEDREALQSNIDFLQRSDAYRSLIGSGSLRVLQGAKGDGQLTVFDFYDGDLGIHLEDGEDQPPKAPRPPAPQENPGAQNRGDPLVIDLAGTGISTYGLEQDLRFDHDGDGFAESTGWIAPGSGVLVLDADADNVLDNGQELFGDFTRLPGGQLAANGFAALSQYDRNRDGIIDAQDEIWSSLKVAAWESDPRGNPVQMDLTQALVRDAGEGWQGQPPGTLRAKLDAFINETNPAVLDARFEELLFAWTGAEAIAEGSFTNQLDARHARVLEQAYGRSFQNPNADQAAAWQLTYERLSEGLCSERGIRKMRALNKRSWRRAA